MALSKVTVSACSSVPAARIVNVHKLEEKVSNRSPLIGHFRVALNLVVKARLSAKFLLLKLNYGSFHSNGNN